MPFSGPSGRLLDIVLSHNGLDREQIRVTNAVLCHPAGNRTPSAKEVACCWPRLRKEIAAHPRKAIVTLGNTATQQVMGSKQGVTAARVGPPKRSQYFGDTPVIPTFHPAACLRNGDYFPHLVADLGKVSGEQVAWEEPKYRVFDEPEQALAAIKALHHRGGEMVIDIEVGIEKDTDFDHPERYTYLCIGIGYDNHKVAVLGEMALKDERVRKALAALLAEKKWVAHNGKFDLAGVGPIGPAQLYFDTMLASYCLDEKAGTHGLKYLAVELLGAPRYDDDLKRYVGPKESYSVVPREVLYKYNAYDVACTWMLWKRYEEELGRKGLRQLHDDLIEVSEALRKMEVKGVRIDQAHLDKLTDEYLRELERLRELLRPYVENPNSWQQVQGALSDLLQKPYSISTDEAHLKDLQYRFKGKHPELEAFCELLLQHRREAKLYGTYVKGARARLYRGRLHPTYLIHGTTSGRLACRNPNLHNVPRESLIRRLYIPEEGNVLVQADYSTVELRVVAVEARDANLADLLQEGRDIHNDVAARFFGVDFTKDQRVRAKAVVYGLTYGREAASLAAEFKIPFGEAQGYLNTFFELIPDTVRWKEWIKEQVFVKNKGLRNHFGRRRRYPLITNDNKLDIEKEAYSWVPQSTANDICMRAMVRLSHMGLDIRIPVHDSLLVECREEDAEEVAELMASVMRSTAYELYSDFVPFPVESKVGRSWGEV